MDASGAGHISVRFTVQANTGAAREGRIEVRWPGAQLGENIIIMQAAGGGGPPPITTITTTINTTTSSTTTTTSVTLTFQAALWDPGHIKGCGSCHGWSSTGSPDPARNFAIPRCVAGNPSASPIRREPAQENGEMHGGGTLWPSGSAAYNAVTAWINGGCSP
jgi:hypothetical protein